MSPLSQDRISARDIPTSVILPLLVILSASEGLRLPIASGLLAKYVGAQYTGASPIGQLMVTLLASRADKSATTK